jgi:Ala-tRNA(Pro) deacylase
VRNGSEEIRNAEEFKQHPLFVSQQFSGKSRSTEVGMIFVPPSNKNRQKGGIYMPILRRLKELLDEAKVSYEVYNHPLAYTAQEIAAQQHFSGKEMAKVVMLEVDGRLIMGVIPGSQKINLNTAKTSLAAKEVRLATENEFISRFPECEIGAMPPFGNMFEVSVVVDPALEKDEYIYFNAGNHVQTVRLKYADFAQLVRPQVARLVEERKRKAA